MSRGGVKRKVELCNDCGTQHVNATPGCVCYLCEGTIGAVEAQPHSSRTVIPTVIPTSLSLQGDDASKRLPDALYCKRNC